MLNLNKLKQTVRAETISKAKGEENTFIFRKGFYYTFGNTSEKFANDIVDQIIVLGYSADIIDSNEIRKPFRGGATVKNSSHFYAKIKISI